MTNSWFEKTISTSSHSTQLIVTGIVASLVTAGTIITLLPYIVKTKDFDGQGSEVKLSKPKVRRLSPLGVEDKCWELSSNLAPNDSEILIQEQLARNRVFLGEAGMEKLRSAKLVIVGGGGVGSWAAVMLARSGVFNMRVIDFDQVTLSSLNRHAAATRAEVGVPKVIAIKRYIKQFAPSVKVDARNELFNLQSAPTLLEGSPDLVLDCIDNINTKIELLKYCVDHSIPVVSSMGAGAKADPTKIQLADISETMEDPLARSVRRLLREKGIRTGIPVVYSTEKPGSVKLLPLDETKAQDAKEYAILPEFRSRILPVLGTIPAMFGMSLASYSICTIAGYPMEPLAIKQREGLYQRLLRDLSSREKNLHNCTTNPPFDIDDLSFLVEEVWRGRSAISGEMDKLKLVRWDPESPLSFTNCVLLSKSESVRHSITTTAELSQIYPKLVLDYVDSRFEIAKLLNKQRDLPPYL